MSSIMDLCPHCSQKVNVDFKFCNHCGGALSFASRSTPTLPEAIATGAAVPVGIANGIPAGQRLPAQVQPNAQASGSQPISGTSRLENGLRSFGLAFAQGLAETAQLTYDLTNKFFARPGQNSVQVMNHVVTNVVGERCLGGGFQVLLPLGVAPGQVMKVVVPQEYPPHSGREIQFMIPVHAEPGGVVWVPLPKNEEQQAPAESTAEAGAPVKSTAQGTPSAPQLKVRSSEFSC